MSTVRTSLPTAALVLLAASLSAQDKPQPPKILRIVEENVKAYKGAAHEKNEMAWATANAAADSKAYYVALVPSTGGTTVVYLQGFQSYADIERAGNAAAKVPGLQARIDAITDKDAEYVTSVRTMQAQFRPDLSCCGPTDHSKVHGYRLTTYRVRIGHTAEFEEARNLAKAVTEKANPDSRLGVFSVTQGATVPTYMVFRPFTSLSEFDGDSARDANVAAQTTAEDRAKVEKLYESSLISREQAVYMISPKQSYIPVNFADSDPFWKTNPVIAAANAKKGGVAQAGAPKSAKKR